MPLPTYRYPLDPTGLNPDNAVNGEVHTLTNKPVRALVAKYGPFFNESITVYDNATNRLLTKNTEYKTVGLFQEATAKFGKEICEVVLILNTNVSSQVRINYQSLGGMYQNTSDSIKKIYETVLNDNRPVDWVNVLNKPLDYPPSLHRHLLEDIYGFEPVVHAIERLTSAVTLRNIPAFETLIDRIQDEIGTLNQVINNATLQALNTKSDKGHIHPITDITSLQNELNNKSNINHTHQLKTINNTDIRGEGNLALATADHTHPLADLSEVFAAINSKSDKTHGHRLKTINGESLWGDGNIEIIPPVQIQTIYAGEVTRTSALNAVLYSYASTPRGTVLVVDYNSWTLYGYGNGTAYHGLIANLKYEKTGDPGVNWWVQTHKIVQAQSYDPWGRDTDHHL